jgi:hypothetical protein
MPVTFSSSNRKQTVGLIGSGKKGLNKSENLVFHLHMAALGLGLGVLWELLVDLLQPFLHMPGPAVTLRDELWGEGQAG